MSKTDALGDKENSTVDTATLAGLPAKNISGVKKGRSKSIGPGGLDAHQSGAENRQKSPAATQYKSILKPSVILFPPKTILPRNVNRKTSSLKPSKVVTPEKAQEGLLIDLSTPKDNSSISDHHALPDSLGDPQASVDGPTRVWSSGRDPECGATRSDHEQQAIAKEKERQELVARKDARRKSLANRRVSFAPEATLHTWDVVEMPEDSTTSSASTNATRRTSTLSAAAVSPYRQPRSPITGSDASQPPSTPPKQVEEIQVTASPAHQRDLHQKKRRRSSGIPPMNFNHPDDFSSSPISVDSANSAESNHTSITAEEDVDSSDSDDKDLVEEETITGIDGEDITIRSSDGSSTGSSGTLEEALRQAARQAGTQGIDHDENADITMEMVNDEVTAAFKPWADNGRNSAEDVSNTNALQDQENIDPFSLTFQAKVRNSVESDREETMDLTQAVGMILQSSKLQKPFSVLQRSPQKMRSSERRKSDRAHRRSSGASSSFSDGTMDLTLAVGGIQHNQRKNAAQHIGKSMIDEADRERTMDFTAVIGGIVNDEADQMRRNSGGSLSNEEDMDFTLAGGGILKSITECTEPAEDKAMGTDVTKTTGAILPEHLRTSNNAQAKDLMERETDNGHLSRLAIYREVKKTPEADRCANSRASEYTRAVASETGSPSLTVLESPASSKKNGKRSSFKTPKIKPRTSTAVSTPTTPSKQLTPRTPKPVTPGKTPPAKNVSMRAGSPRKLFETEEKEAAPIQDVKAGGALIRQDRAASGVLSPSTVQKRRSRRSSGLGVDRVGIGSPRVTELLNGRGSIVENASKFATNLQLRSNVRFTDPYTLEQELNQERMEDHRRESAGEFVQSEGTNENLEHQIDSTRSLKDKIESLTPQKKKRKLNGRKSLHAGAARGLLGKRPAELDNEEDEEDEDDSTPKRLKGRDSSPVKKVKLPPPPSRSATTGRMTRSSRASLEEVEMNACFSTPLRGNSPGKQRRAATPKDQLHLNDAGTDNSLANVGVLLNAEKETNGAAFEKLPGDEPMHLQDFLNLTSIRFMELTTTKRRHTIIPNGSLDNNTAAAGAATDSITRTEADSELQKCVVIGACTLPMLELYQHSCRELKNYITEGRTIVREIEDETQEENPPLFREYLSAPSDIKSIMDNQFRNVKTHARLLSKAMWYEWRMKLLEGLKEGLVKNGEGMDEDAEAFTCQEQLVGPILPRMMEEQNRLQCQIQNLETQVADFANCDQEELKGARSSLVTLEEDVVAKRKTVEDLEAELSSKEQSIVDATERRTEYVVEIEEAEKVRQISQGWESSEVTALQSSVAALQQTYGWTITSASDAALTMTYKGTIQLFFAPHSFRTNYGQTEATLTQTNAPISLGYIADAHQYHPKPLTTEKRFFLQVLRAQLQFLEQSKVKVNELLTFVGSSWERACNIAEEARTLRVRYISEPTILSDETLAVRSVILLRDIRTKVVIDFEVSVRSVAGTIGVDVAVEPSARVVYGEELNAKKMSDFLSQKLGGKRKGKDSNIGRWAQIVRELEERLVARGKK